MVPRGCASPSSGISFFLLSATDAGLGQGGSAEDEKEARQEFWDRMMVGSGKNYGQVGRVWETCL